MSNRLEGMLHPVDSPAIPVYRHPAPSQAPEELFTVARRWALEHPLPCLVTAFTLGAFMAWFVKRK